jgi:hypothetical protein
MPTVTLTIDERGKPAGVSERDCKAYAKFRKRLAEMSGKDSITFTWREPRSGPFHKRHFVMVGALYEAQEQFADPDMFRKWLEVGAGYCDLLPGPKGRMVAVPRSIAYERLDQADFEPIHEAVFAFARSEHARRFLWPHLTDAQTAEMVDAVLREFETL